MNGDNQMDPDEMLQLCTPVATRRGGLHKGEPALHRRGLEPDPALPLPRQRDAVADTKIASGYWHVADSQAGYTAINRRMLELLDLENVYPRYGYPNDMLVHLNVWSARVRDIPSRPIYGIGEKSGIRLRSVVPRISWLLMKGFFWRMGHRYVIRDFHPLVFFYMAGFFSFLIGIALASYAVGGHFSGHPPNAGTAILVALMMTFSVLFTLFAMWFDMETNKDLR